MEATNSRNHNAAVTATHKSYVTALMDQSLYNAALQGETDVFQQVHDKYPLEQLLTPYNNSILHIHIASSQASLDFVKAILNLCPNLLWQFNNKEESLLHIAARYGHDDILQLLIEKTGEMPNQSLRIKNKVKDTPLHEAVRFEHIKVVRTLIEWNIEGSQDINDAGETPFYLAVERGYEDIVKEMIESSVTLQAYYGPNGRTALHAAILSNSLDLTQLLLSWEWALINKPDAKGWYPIHYAAYYGYTNIVTALLDVDESVAYHATGKEKETALHIAAKSGYVKIMSELITRCSCCVELVDARNWNVVHFAVKSNNKEAIKFLLNNPSLCAHINEYNSDGDTPIHQLAISGSFMNDFIQHSKVDKLAFNKQNLNALDLALESHEPMPMQRPWLEIQWRKCGVEKSRRTLVDKDEVKTDKEEVESEKEEEGSSTTNNGTAKGRKDRDRKFLSIIRREREGYLIGAALIATVSFAAGLTAPGGFKDDDSQAPGGFKDDDNQAPGSPILLRNAAFQVFVAANYAAFLFSSLAVLYHLSVTFSRKKLTIISNFMSELLFTFYAMICMLVAFISGTYAVLAPYPRLNITLCVIGCIFAFAAHSKEYSSIKIIMGNYHTVIIGILSTFLVRKWGA